MPFLAELSPLDEHLLLLNRVHSVLEEPRRRRSPRISVRDDNGLLHVISPVRVLGIMVRGAELDGLLGEDADYGPLVQVARGDLRGGGIAERDKWFGFDNNVEFKRWWHRIGKKSLGRDLQSRKEADYWHDVYVGSQYLLADSIFCAYISLLSFREQKIARRLLALLSIQVFRALDLRASDFAR